MNLELHRFFLDKEELDDLADFIITTASDNLIKNGNVDTGELLSSVRKVHHADGSISIIWDDPVSEFIEKGTPPHWPPVAPLKRWAGRKLGDESAGYAVAMKIAKEGTDPHPFIVPAVEAAKARFNFKKR